MCWMLLYLWVRGLFVPKFGFTNLVGNFEHLNTFKHYVSEFWVETYVSRLPYDDLVCLYLSLSWLMPFWAWLSGDQMLSVSCIPIILNSGVFPLPMYFLSTCCEVRKIMLLGILLAACCLLWGRCVLYSCILLVLFCLHDYVFLFLYSGFIL